MKINIYFVEEGGPKEKYHPIGEITQEAYPPIGTIINLKKDDTIKKIIDNFIKRVEADKRTPENSTIWEGMKKVLFDFDDIGVEIERYELMEVEGNSEIRAYVTFFVSVGILK